jgi:hypothetical protein
LRCSWMNFMKSKLQRWTFLSFCEKTTCRRPHVNHVLNWNIHMWLFQIYMWITRGNVTYVVPILHVVMVHVLFQFYTW